MSVCPGSNCDTSDGTSKSTRTDGFFTATFKRSFGSSTSSSGPLFWIESSRNLENTKAPCSCVLVKIDGGGSFTLCGVIETPSREDKAAKSVSGIVTDPAHGPLPEKSLASTNNRLINPLGSTPRKMTPSISTLVVTYESNFVAVS